MNFEPSIKAIKWIFKVLRRFFRLEGPHHAAAMAFFSMLALVPGVLLLANALARVFIEVPVEGGASPLEQTLNGLEMALPAFKGSVREVVEDLAASHSSLNIVSALSLLFAAGGAFAALERGMNLMLGTSERRHFLGTRFLLAGMLLSAALAMFMWQVVKSIAPRISATIGLDMPDWLLTNPVSTLFIQLGVTAAGFYILVRVLSTEHFSRIARWSGAIVFASLFHLTRVGLDVYLETTPLQQVYGTFMALIGLILWLYLISVLLLLSCAAIKEVELLQDPGAPKGERGEALKSS